MTIDISPIAAALVIAFLLPWSAVWAFLLRMFHYVLGHALRLHLQRRHGLIYVYFGAITRPDALRLTMWIRRHAARRREITIVLDTRGGEMSSADQVLHALAQYPAHVTVRVVDECWSAGTVIACGADRLIMAPDANIGFTDSICHLDPADLLTGPVLTAVERGESVDVVRAKHCTASTVRTLASAMETRGVDGMKALERARALTLSDEDHHEPIFPERARELGFNVRIDDNQIWYRLIVHIGRSR